ncbi:nitroreductase [Coralliovum pocilloporae]|uniref:nitroreductase n=1 Tax=Coralliovum pocilloporae TaxID=3066369 RepID=UPI003307A429
MIVTEAVRRRMSCRAFRPDPVPDDALRAILETALWSPSGSNMQPWHIHVVRGESRNKLVQAIQNQSHKLPDGEGSELAFAPSPLPDPYKTRSRECGMALYEAIGIERSDRAGRLAQYAQNLAFFGAPVGLFFTVDRSFDRGQWGDIGMLMQTIMLLACEHGLDTCAQQSWLEWPQTLTTHLSIPDNHVLVCGMSLGYGDETHPINQWRTRRDPLENCTTFHD